MYYNVISLFIGWHGMLFKYSDLSELSILGICAILNRSQSHVIRSIGKFNRSHPISLEHFYDLTVCRSFQKCFNVENIILSKNTVISSGL